MAQQPHDTHSGNDREHLGAIVRTSDDSDIGVVVRVLGDYIQVEDDSDGLMWLSKDDIASSDGDHAILDFPRSDLSARMMTPPDAYGQSQYLRELSPEERDQRWTILRQLAEQRAEIYGEGEALDTDGTLGEPVEEELERLEAEEPNVSDHTWRQ